MMAAGEDSGSREKRGSRVDQCPGLGPLTGCGSVQVQDAGRFRDRAQIGSGMMRVSSGTGRGSVQGQEASRFRDRRWVGSGTECWSVQGQDIRLAAQLSTFSLPSDWSPVFACLHCKSRICGSPHH